MAEFEVNRYITLKLEGRDTNIYINDEFFILCKHLLINISNSKIDDFNKFNSIDEVTQDLELGMPQEYKISPEEEFIGHCSNLQVWAENDYNTNLLRSNISFPLLKKLTEVGDLKARNVFKEEIVRRILGGYKQVLIYLIQAHFLELLNEEELTFLSNTLDSNVKNSLTHIIVEELMINLPKKYKASLYKILSFLDEELASNLLYVECGDEKFFVNNYSLNLTFDIRNKYRIKSMTEIKGLKKLTQLKSLRIKDHFLSHISGLEDLISLEFLDLSRNNIGEIQGLNKCSKLRDLLLGDNEIKEIKNLGFLNCLEFLDLRFNNINKIGGLEKLRNLKRLSLDRNYITKIEGLDNLVNLESLSLLENKITKIEGLDKLVNLKSLNVRRNNDMNHLFKKFGHNGKLYVEYSKNK
ncbi:hypothetical protein LCGC14_0586710 [marine sediment metagenome]|uniref:Leucine-rich repeat domain-containing protein n=1 Tax=marine sediment metagenome TaxID=412755 RepID=A0A0F9RES2_9ZZZZ|nr:MAG: leucine-rich repeat domain protein [Candidatus Lokiarchaeum sp. GC14_75]